jgi:hypothetical protein
MSDRDPDKARSKAEKARKAAEHQREIDDAWDDVRRAFEIDPVGCTMFIGFVMFLVCMTIAMLWGA